MSPNFDNRKRAFADVVAIDAWHEPFDGEQMSVDLHADIVFGAARVGGEIESPVRFRLSIKRAEVVVVVPPTEPVKVDRSSVSRDSPDLPTKMTEVIEQTTAAQAKATAGASVGPTAASVSISAELAAQGSVSASRKYESSGSVEFMVVTQSKTADGHYRWNIEPRRSRVLEGRPWDAVAKPRLKLIDKRRDRTKSLPPAVRVEVRCRREDLVIEDLVVKDESLWTGLKSKTGFANRMAAAESYIRDRLEEEGFVAKNISDIFSELTLGAATAESS